MELIIIRGLPGSGKTTLAINSFGDALHYEADFFFEEDGEYIFDSRLLKQAHAWCQAMAERAMARGSHNVVVSNTFTQKWEMQPYLDMALKYGHTVRVIHTTGEFKSVHNVPNEQMEKMRFRWEQYP